MGETGDVSQKKQYNYSTTISILFITMHSKTAPNAGLVIGYY